MLVYIFCLSLILAYTSHVEKMCKWKMLDGMQPGTYKHAERVFFSPWKLYAQTFCFKAEDVLTLITYWEAGAFSIVNFLSDTNNADNSGLNLYYDSMTLHVIRNICESLTRYSNLLLMQPGF